jgi:signal transduction histidine kinase/DNA-binding response OmpR family regulator
VLARPGLPAVVRAAREIQVAGETLLRSPTVVTAHLVDSEGGIWVAAVGRLTRLQRQPVRRLGEGLPPFNAYTVFEDRDGDVWVGTADQGVLRFRAGSLVERVDEARGLPAAHAWSVARAPDGTPWIGSFGLCRMAGDACERVPMEGLASRQQVRAVYFDRHGRLWVGADPGLFRGDGGRVVRVAGVPERPVAAFAEDARGVLWAATSGAGLWRITDEGVRVFGAESGLPSLLLRSVRPDADGGLWLASEDRGLLYALPVGDRLLVRAIGTNEGLPVDGVHQVLDDGGGHLWMSSNYGIFRARRADLLDLVRGRAARVPTVLYGERDGLPHREANGGVHSAGARLRDGRLLFPTQGGVAVVDPAVARPRPWRPTPRFEGVTAGDRPLAPEGGAFRLEPHERDFAVAFTAPAFARPEDTRFRHRLDGFDADWIEGRDSHRAFYTRVAPGRYRFRVAARDADHDWLEADAPLEIVVRPRFHETPWFAALVVLAVLAGVAGLVRVRIRRLLANERALAAMVADRTAQLERSTAAARAGQAAVERQATALRALDEAKTRFFAHIHHELRTPLTLIAGPLDELLRGDVPPGLRPPLELMQRNARRLRRLTDQILDLERGEAGLRPTSLAPVDLRQLAERTLEPFRAVAGRRRFSLHGEGPAVALADPELTETVVTNLLSNAVKFTEEGGRIDVAVERAGDHVRLSVADDGCGIPEADQPRIFDRFYRVDSDGLRSGEGSGLGLALVRQLVTAQGGEVSVESRPGEGARFHVTLAACDAAPGRPAVGARADAEAALLAALPCADDPAEDGRPTVLVVDDNPDLRRFVGALLSPRHTVRYAADGEDGLKRAREELPDLVVADVMMPGLDGMALAAALAADPETTSIPVLLLTARAGVETEVRGLRSGAVDFLGKPFDAEVLRARVDVILGRRTRLRDALRDEPSPAPAAAEPEVTARVRAVVLARLDDETLDAEALARAVGMSRPTLSRRLAAEGAPSPAAFVRAVRLERAHALLSQGAGNVSEVAVAVGFNSLAQFSRAFREAHGVPPSHVIPRG